MSFKYSQKGEFLICDSKQTSFVNLKKYFEHLLAFTYITFELEMVSKTQLSIFENSILFITSHSVILPTNFDKMNAVKRSFSFQEMVITKSS